MKTTMELTDLQIIHAAEKAGLCLPKCWYLENFTDEETLSGDEEWAEGDPERTEYLNREKAQYEDRMKQLRAFIIYAKESEQLFETVEEVVAACDRAKLDHRHQYDRKGRREHYVDIYGGDSRMAYMGNDQTFLNWANAHFTVLTKEAKL
jgi:hypothetical protein